MREQIRIEGLAELERALLALPRQIARRHVTRSLMGGARLIEADAESRVPILNKPDPRRRPGTIRRNIRSRPVRADLGMAATVIVGVRRLSGKQIVAFKKRGGGKGASNPDDPFYWRFVEFGTRKMPARPFLRPAFESRKYAAAHHIKAALQRGIQDEASRLAPK